MTTAIECALMAGASYISTRPDPNKFPIPSGWIEKPNSYFNDPSTGFEAVSFQRGTEIVISFAGTYPKNPDGNLLPLIPVDLAADIGLATGFGSDQLLQAAEYYLQVKAANPPGTVITLTGHSLGGGLAALVGVFFDVSATTFDQAPFANTAELNLLTPNVAVTLKADLLGRGYTEAQLSGLTNFLALRQVNGGIPNSSLINTIRVEGELLSIFPIGLYDPIGNPATMIQHSPTSVTGTDLHSQALLTAFLQSQQTAATGKALNDVTYKLTDLLGMIFDKNLFANDTDTDKRNLLEHLVRHEAGVGATAATAAIAPDAMVTRFTEDLWKLAQDGGLTLSENLSYSNWNNVSKALIAFAMQKYYDEPASGANHGNELFSTDGLTGGIQFDTANVVGEGKAITGAKGYQYFQAYLDQTGLLSAEERTLIQSLLPTLRDWYVQAGTGGMTATDAQNRGDFMLGGAGADTLTGGTEADLLIGNAGDDHLQGGKNNDTLIGGAGNDTYLINPGDGYDTVLDSDGSGVIEFGTVEAKGDAGLTDATKWKQLGTDTWADTQNGITYSKSVVNGETQLLIHQGDANVVVKGWSEGELGIALDAGTPLATSAVNSVLTGTAADNFISDEVYDRAPDSEATQDARSGSQPDKTPPLAGNAASSLIEGGGGHDVVSGGAGDDLIYADQKIADLAAYIAASATAAGSTLRGDWLSGGLGDDTVVGGADNDILFGGGGKDLIVGGAGDDVIDGDDNYIASGFDSSTATPGSDPWDPYFGPMYTVDYARDVGAADVIYGGSGNDIISGMMGDDVLLGETGNDIIAGGDASDTILGGAGDDQLTGEDNQSPLADGLGTPDYGDDFIDGGAGNDTLWGESGYYTLDARSRATTCSTAARATINCLAGVAMTAS